MDPRLTSAVEFGNLECHATTHRINISKESLIVRHCGRLRVRFNADKNKGAESEIAVGQIHSGFG